MKNRFNPYSWGAEIYNTPKEIYAALGSFGIYGKAIDRVTVIGLAGTKAENTVYQNLLACGIPPSQMKNYEDNALVPCSITVSEPVIITFEDNSTFEFQLMYGNQLKMSVNQLSADIINGVNNSNIDSDRLFTKLKGCKIEKLYIRQNITNVYWGNSDSFEYDNSDFEFVFRCDDSEDYNNPALNEMKKFYTIFDLGYPHKSALESETDEYEIFYTIDVDEEQFKKENIGVAIDFYNRFCWILQQMMEHNPDNEFISFMGP